MIAIVSDDGQEIVGAVLKEAVFTWIAGHPFAANTMDIKPCAACAAAAGRHARCVIRMTCSRCCQDRRVPGAVGISCGIRQRQPSYQKVMDRMAAVGNPRCRVSGGSW